MQLYSISINEIEDDLIDFFRSEWPQHPAPIFPGTDVRNTFNYPPKAWAELADRLSEEPWMRQINVRLFQADMRNLSTVEHIALLISKRLRHVVAPHAQMPVTPLTSLMRARTPAPASAVANVAPPVTAKKTRVKRTKKGKDTKKAKRAG